MLLNEMKRETYGAHTLAPPNFYGSRARTGPNVLVFDKFGKGRESELACHDAMKHRFTFTPDAARSGSGDDGRKAKELRTTWAVPTATDPPDGKTIH